MPDEPNRYLWSTMAMLLDDDHCCLADEVLSVVSGIIGHGKDGGLRQRSQTGACGQLVPSCRDLTTFAKLLIEYHGLNCLQKSQSYTSTCPGQRSLTCQGSFLGIVGIGPSSGIPKLQIAQIVPFKTETQCCVALQGR